MFAYGADSVIEDTSLPDQPAFKLQSVLVLIILLAGNLEQGRTSQAWHGSDLLRPAKQRLGSNWGEHPSHEES